MPVSMPLPGKPAPALDLDLIDGHRWSLAARRPRAFTMIVAYRGLHCPICRNVLSRLRDGLDDWIAKGVDVLAVSMDAEDRARRSYEAWDLKPLALGYGMTEAQARDWGLYLSSARAEKEPAVFSEPGLFWVRPDGTLWLAEMSSTPFVRPDMDLLLSKLDFILEKDYPPRGTHEG